MKSKYSETETEWLFKDLLEENGYFDSEDLIIEFKDKTKSEKVKKLLSNASKKGSKNGIPDFIIRSNKHPDIIFLIENELGTAVSTADDLIKIGHFIDEKSIKNLKIWFDIANYYRIDPKVGQLIQKLKNYIYYIHCKNYIINDSGIYYVELGKGIINFKTLIHEIREHFINLIFSLEVHEKELDKKAEVVRKSYLTLSEYIDGD